MPVWFTVLDNPFAFLKNRQFGAKLLVFCTETVCVSTPHNVHVGECGGFVGVFSLNCLLQSLKNTSKTAHILSEMTFLETKTNAPPFIFQAMCDTIAATSYHPQTPYRAHKEVRP
jgi:hypothetical protein